ncbi:hypothetical protein N8H41_24645 [Pseudomonas vlassakiae]|uniref:hypothetical protein n=1 Tax=Pseudomonas vlassakiae TaxID=485888 RepID=UPI0021C9607C|nr:hypothetical protein [Pseudomonas vlassakiae]MCU0127165.1 hypothetical protein [Pseudomonas vlassakiae]
MFTVERFFAKIWSAWLLVVMIAVMMIGVSPPFFIIPSALAMVSMSVWCIECAFRTERFVVYANLRLFFNLSIAPLFAALLTMAVSYKKMKLGGFTSTALCLAPVVLALLAYGLVCVWPGKTNVLEFEGLRVESVEPPEPVRWWQAGLGAGLSSLIYPLMKSHDVPMTGLIYFFVFMALFMIFYNRDKIWALRALKAREAKKNCRYTFRDVDAIRAQRSASWLGRLFAVRTNGE